MARTPAFGESRTDVYLQATEDIPAGCLVRSVRRPRHGVKLWRSKRLPFDGVAVTAAKKGKGLWVRIHGAASVRTAK